MLQGVLSKYERDTKMSLLETLLGQITIILTEKQITQIIKGVIEKESGRKVKEISAKVVNIARGYGMAESSRREFVGYKIELEPEDFKQNES